MSKTITIAYKEALAKKDTDMVIHEWLKQYNIYPVCYFYDQREGVHIWCIQFYEWLEDIRLMFMLKFGDKIVPVPRDY